MQIAVVARPGSTTPELYEVPTPEAVTPDQVLCRTIELGICGTDREILHSGKPLTPRGSDYLILGHECLARIEAVGSANYEWNVGDFVVPAVRRPLPEQSRRLDLLPLGKYTERGIWEEHGFSQPLWLDRPEHLFRVPEEIADLAVFTEPLAVAEKAVNEARLLQQARLGDRVWNDTPPRVLVTGQGPIGFAGCLAGLARGWDVTMYGRDPSDSFRSTLAQKLGVAYWPDDQTSFELHDAEEEGFDLILECTGSDELMVKSTSALRSCGIMVWLGSHRKPHPRQLDVARMMRDGLLKNHLHIGSVNSAPRDFEDALTHLSQLKSRFSGELQSLVTARVSMIDSLWHFENRQPQGIKTVIQYDTQS